MNTAANGDTELTELRAQVADLQAQRAQLFAEVQRLRSERDEAIGQAASAQQENTLLRARIAELEDKA